MIRSIDPEFWRSGLLAGIEMETVYDGIVPRRRVNVIAPARSGFEYVYMLFGDDDWLLYVGRSFRPADRLHVHLRKAWGHLVTGMLIIKVTEAPGWRPGPGPNTARLESVAIAMLHPFANIAAPSRMAMS